jgi:hypothetical protein
MIDSVLASEIRSRTTFACCSDSQTTFMLIGGLLWQNNGDGWNPAGYGLMDKIFDKHSTIRIKRTLVIDSAHRTTEVEL